MSQRLSGALYNGSTPVAVQLWYLDWDGDRVDDVVALLLNRSVVVSKGTSSGYLTATPLTTVMNTSASAFAVTDVNRDGLVDLVRRTLMVVCSRCFACR